MKYDIKQLTLDEKLHLLTGKDTWRLETANGKLPEVFLADGPHGLRMINIADRTTKKATAMPNLCVLANTWDTELAYLQGNTIADDCIENGASVLLAPGVNIKRTPLCGRNFEYFSEDPYLAGTMAKAYIQGVQAKGIGTSLKHYYANNREYDRFYQNSELDERTAREIYLPAFEIALEAKPWTVMCAYNPINGIWASENPNALRDTLRTEFGFDGLIMSDWEAVHCSWRAAKATLDLRMPYHPQAYDELKTGLEKGYITEAEIDARVEKILALIEKTQNENKIVTTTKEIRHENAVQIAREGMVLLKNEDDILPLRGGNVLVSGPFAEQPAMGGSGSAYVQTEYAPKPVWEELAVRLGNRANVRTCDASLWKNIFLRNIRSLYEAAYTADAVVLCMGTGKTIEGEEFDRETLRLSPTQEDYIINTAKVNKNVIVVLSAGSAIDVSPWIDQVKGVLLAGFAGEGANEAIADLLTGKACPCGKLNETFPVCLEDTPTGEARGNGFSERYAEGVFVGYRWYDQKNAPVQFPFGFGLSYADFEYSDLTIDKRGETDYEISYTVKNVSNVDGKEISQLYVRDVFAMVNRPQKELKGFAKTTLKAGESKRVSHTLRYRDFAYYSTNLKKWYVENGAFEILIGADSRDIRLIEKLEINLPENEQFTR